MSFNYCNLNDVKTWLAGVDVSDMPSSLDLMIEKSYIPWAKRQVDIYIGDNLDNTTVTEYIDGSGGPELILRHRPISFLRKCVLRLIPSVQWFEFKRPFLTNEVDQTGIKVATRGGSTPIGDALPPYVFSANSPVPEDMKSLTPTATFDSATSTYESADLYVDCRLGMLVIPPRILYLDNQAVPFWNYTFLKGYENIEVTYDYGYKDLDSIPAEVRNACAQFVAAAVLQTKGQFTGAGATSLTLGSVPRSYGEMPYAGHIKAYMENAKQALATHKRLKV